MHEDLKKISIKAKKKLKTQIFFWKYVWLGYNHQLCSRHNFAQLSKTILATILCHNKTVLDGLNLLVSVSKFGIDTTKNPWYRIGIVSIYKSWYRPSLLAIAINALIRKDIQLSYFWLRWRRIGGEHWIGIWWSVSSLLIFGRHSIPFPIQFYLYMYMQYWNKIWKHWILI